MDTIDLSKLDAYELRELAQQVEGYCRCREEYGRRVTAFCPIHHSVPNGPYREGARGVLYNEAGEPMNEPEPYYADEPYVYDEYDDYVWGRERHDTCPHGNVVYRNGDCELCEEQEERELATYGDWLDTHNDQVMSVTTVSDEDVTYTTMNGRVVNNVGWEKWNALVEDGTYVRIEEEANV